MRTRAWRLPCVTSTPPSRLRRPRRGYVPRSAILAPGRNCWRIETATRAAFLVDGQDFFGAVRAALSRARHSFFILGWDVDSRMKLAPDVDDGLPQELGPFLNAIVGRRDGLHGHVLAWDYAMLYALEREWWSALRLGRRARDVLPPGRPPSAGRVAPSESHRRRRRGRLRQRIRPDRQPMGYERARLRASVARQPERAALRAVSRRGRNGRGTVRTRAGRALPRSLAPRDRRGGDPCTGPAQ